MLSTLAYNFNSRRYDKREQAEDGTAWDTEFPKDVPRQMNGCDCGRDLHSSTFQLNLSRFSHKIHPKHPLISPNSP